MRIRVPHIENTEPAGAEGNILEEWLSWGATAAFYTAHAAVYAFIFLFPLMIMLGIGAVVLGWLGLA